MWEVRVEHVGLKAYRFVRGLTKQEAEHNANMLAAVWSEKWEKIQAALKVKQERNQRAWDTAGSNTAARSRTAKLEEQRAALESTLTAGLAEQPFQWINLKDTTPFTQPIPKEPIIPANPIEPVASSKPDISAYPVKPNSNLFAPQLSVIDNLIKSRRLEKINKSASEFEEATQNWSAECNTIDELHEKRLLAHETAFQKEFEDYLSNVALWNQARDKALKDYSSSIEMWDQARDKHLATLKTQHAQIDTLCEEYRAGDPSAVQYFFAEVLNHSIYPETFPQGNMLSFNQSSGMMVVDFELPNQWAFPSVKEVKFIASRQQFQEVLLSNAWLRKTYDDVLYQIALRTLHELFIADEGTVLKSIVFNGWVQSIDKATGMETRGCILSIQAERAEFLQINLSQVDPKACFRKLKGVASSKLTDLAPAKRIP